MVSGISQSSGSGKIPAAVLSVLSLQKIPASPVEASVSSLLDVLTAWKMVNSQGVLTYASSITPKSLKGTSLRRWENLLRQEIYIQIGKEKIRMTQGEYAYQFNAFLSKVLGKEVKTYLRGGYALYVIDLPGYFESLVDDFLKDQDEALRAKRKAKIAPLLNDLKIKWERMEVPKDIDWLDLVDCSSNDAKLLSTYFFQELNPSLNPDIIRKNAFCKLVKTARTFLKTECSQSFLISSLKTENLSTDRTIGNLSHASIASWCDIFIPIEPIKDRLGNEKFYPETKVGLFPQVIADWALRVLRVQPWHGKNFPALAAFCQYLYQGFELLPNKHAIEEALLGTRTAIQTDNAFEEMVTDIEARICGHAIEPISFLFSLALQFSFGPLPIKTWNKLWGTLLQKMEEHVSDSESQDYKLVQYFKLFKEDFPKLTSSLVHLSMAAAFHPTEKVSISIVTQGGVILKIGKNHLYLRKDLFERELHLETSSKLEDFFPSKELKTYQNMDKSLEEVLENYIMTTSRKVEIFNPYLHFVHFCHGSEQQTPSQFLKDFLLRIVDPKVTADMREQVLERMSRWYPTLKGKKNAKGADLLHLIAKDSLQDALEMLASLGDQKKHYLFSFLMALTALNPTKVLILVVSPELTDKEKGEILEAIFKNAKSDESTLREAALEIKKLDYALSHGPLIIRRLWQKEGLTQAGNAFFHYAIERHFLAPTDIENLMGEFLLNQDATTCYIFARSLPPDISLSSKITDRIASLKTSIRNLEQDEKCIIQRYIEKLPHDEAYQELQRFLDDWDEDTYHYLFTKIFKEGFHDPKFILEICEVKRQISPTEEFKKIYQDFFESFLNGNLTVAIQFLFLPLSFEVLSHPHKELRASLIDRVKGKELVLYLEKLIEKLDENLDLIEKVIQSSICNIHQLSQLKKFFKTHGKTIGDSFADKHRYQGLVSLQHLLNLLNIESDPELEEPFLLSLETQEHLSIEVLVGSLQSKRFPTARKNALLMRTLTACTSEAQFKLLIDHLELTSLSKADFQKIQQIPRENPLLFAHLIERFSTHESFTHELIKIHDLLIKLPLDKLYKLLKKSHESFHDLTPFIPLIKFLLAKEIQDSSLLLYVMQKLGLYDLSLLSPLVKYIFEVEKSSLRKSLFDVLIEIEPSMDRKDPLYFVIWNRVLREVPSLHFEFTELLSLADNPPVFSHRGALLLAAVKKMPEIAPPFEKIVNIWMKTEPSSQFLETLIKLIETRPFNLLNPLISKIYRRFCELLKEEDSKYAVLGLLTVFKEYDFPDPMDLFKTLVEKIDESMLELFFDALVNQNDLLNSIGDFLKIAIQRFPSISSEIAESYVEKLKEDEVVKIEAAIQLVQGFKDIGILDTPRYSIHLFYFYSTLIEEIVDADSFEFDKFRSVLNEWMDLSPKISWEEKMGFDFFKLTIMLGLAKSLPYLDRPTDLLDLFLKTYKSYFLVDWTTPENIKFKNFLFLNVSQLILNLSDCSYKDEDLIDKVFFPFSEYFIHVCKADHQEKSHLRYLFFLGLSLVDPVCKDHPYTFLLKQLTSSIWNDETTRDFYNTCIGICSEPVSSDSDSSEDEEKTPSENSFISKKDTEWFLDFFKIFPSNFNLDRGFKCITAVLKNNKLIPSQSYFSKILDAFQRILKFKNLKLDYLINFVSLYIQVFEDYNHKTKNFSHAEIDYVRKIAQDTITEFLAFIKEIFKKEEINLIQAYKAYIYILRRSLEMKILYHDKYLDLLNHIQYLDENLKRKFEVLVTPLEKIGSIFEMVMEGFEVTPIFHNHIKRERYLADWLLMFFNDPEGQALANPYLDRYLKALESILSENYEEYLHKVAACFPANRQNTANLALIGNALLAKSSGSISDSLLNLKAKLFVDWAYPFHKDHPTQVNALVRKAMEQNLFKNGGFKAFWTPR